jgi:hypothetical protein
MGVSRRARSVLALPNMLTAGARYGLRGLPFGQLLFANRAWFSHYVCHSSRLPCAAASLHFRLPSPGNGMADVTAKVVPGGFTKGEKSSTSVEAPPPSLVSVVVSYLSPSPGLPPRKPKGSLATSRALPAVHGQLHQLPVLGQKDGVRRLVAANNHLVVDDQHRIIQ